MRLLNLVALATFVGGGAASLIRGDVIGHEEYQNCSTTVPFDVANEPWDTKIFGVNLGGWLVLEPWITPSLFYQFLGQQPDKVAMDSLSFCRVLGPEEGNIQLRRHWKTWLTEDHFFQLAQVGINSVRLPVGDWMYETYEPFTGCYDGALDYVDKAIVWANKYNMTVLIDMHAWKGSANGLDNGGSTVGLRWTSTLQDISPGLQTFEHWPRRSAEWLGTFNPDNISYTIDWDKVDRSLRVLEKVVKRYKGYSNVFGLEPVNEPWQFTPLKALKYYYWKAYWIVRKHTEGWRLVIHDSFRFSIEIWGEFMKGCPDVVLDTHIYQAWFDPSVRYNYYTNACGQRNLIKLMQTLHPVIVGEWSLATDNCAMWLNGFNDNLPGYPRMPCKYVTCADPYMGHEQPGAPPSRVTGAQGPYGTGMSGPIWGFCPKSRDWPKTSKFDDEDLGLPPVSDVQDLYSYVPPEEDDTDVVMTTLAAKKLSAFATEAYGFYFWNFRSEFEDQWSYLRAVERNWIPADLTDVDGLIAGACESEDSHCRAKKTATDKQIRGAYEFAVGYDPAKVGAIEDITDRDALRRLADIEFEEYWKLHRASDIDPNNKVCDFDGVAELTPSSYRCAALRIDEDVVRNALNYCVGYDPKAVAHLQELHADALWKEADKIFDDFFEMHRYAGVTCDFGGAAKLLVDREVLTQDEARITASITNSNTKAKSTDPGAIPAAFVSVVDSESDADDKVHLIFALFSSWYAGAFVLVSAWTVLVVFATMRITKNSDVRLLS